MCGIIGMFNKNGLTVEELAYFKEMLVRCESRGTDATGVFNQHMQHLKFPEKSSVFTKRKSFRKFLKWTRGCKYIIGHCRHATRGNPKDNTNNHPFFLEDRSIFLVHNGHARCSKFDLDKSKTDTLVYVNAIKHYKDSTEFKDASISDIIEKAFVECEKDNWYNQSVVVAGTPANIFICKSFTSPLFTLWNAEKTRLIFASSREIMGSTKLQPVYLESEVMVSISVDDGKEEKKKISASRGQYDYQNYYTGGHLNEGTDWYSYYY